MRILLLTLFLLTFIFTAHVTSAGVVEDITSDAIFLSEGTYIDITNNLYRLDNFQNNILSLLGQDMQDWALNTALITLPYTFNAVLESYKSSETAQTNIAKMSSFMKNCFTGMSVSDTNINSNSSALSQ
jgi:hypothetical protein